MPFDTKHQNEDTAKAEDMAQRLNISTMNHTFDNFERVFGSEEILATMQTIAKGTDRKLAFFYGTTGDGKTHLIESLLIAWAKQGIFARYSTNSQLMRLLKNQMPPNSIPSYEQMFERICGWDRLIIDDVGMGTVEGPWEIATLEDIINERYHRRYNPHPVITIMATNKDLPQIDDRILSRFYDPEIGIVVCNRAPDYRKRRVK